MRKTRLFRWIGLGLPLCALLLTTVGCGQDAPEAVEQPFLGSWEARKPSGERMVLHFEGDGSYRGERSKKLKRETQAGLWTERDSLLILEMKTENGKPGKDREEFTWRVEGGKLHLRIGEDYELVLDRLRSPEQGE